MPGLLTPRLTFIAVPINRLDKSAPASLIGDSKKKSRGFESWAEMVFPKNLGDPGNSGLSVALS